MGSSGRCKSCSVGPLEGALDVQLEQLNVREAFSYRTPAS